MYVDMMELDRNEKLTEKKKASYRTIIHISFAVLLWLVILVFDALNDKAIIDTILKLAGYTYGPLLGLFAFGLFMKGQINDKLVPIVCLLAPGIAYILSTFSKDWFGGYEIGNELIIINGLITFIGLLFIKQGKQFNTTT
jgi:hypothetical protein